MRKRKCPKCKNELNFLRTGILSRKIYFCEKCGYSFKKTITGIKSDVLIVAKTTTENIPNTIILKKREDLKALEKYGVEIKVLDWRKYEKH